VESLLLEAESFSKPRTMTLGISLVVHGALVMLLVVVPLLLSERLPEPSDVGRAFFVSPPDVAPPPPPPPPPAPAAAAVARTPVAPPVPPTASFVAPVEIPAEAPRPEEGLGFGVEGGVPGGVEGGVPGGVVGGIVGGLPAEAAAPPPQKVVRVGGKIHPPRLINRVAPVYPALATQARVTGLVILEARVGVDGRVKSVQVLRGGPLFDQAAIEAVQQWRYMPLLLNGEPMEFDITITIAFNITHVQAS